MTRQILAVFIAAIVILFATSPPANADTKVYISISLGGGAIIGMVGYFFHVSYSTRVAEKEREKQSVEGEKPSLALKTASSWVSHSPQLARPFEFREKVFSNPFEIKFVTFRW